MGKEMNKAFRATVYGRVQGVGFRYSTVTRAKRLQLKGYVRNMIDGSVEVLAEGEPEKLSRLLIWLKKGPPPSRVINVDHSYIPYTGCYRGFDVEF